MLIKYCDIFLINLLALVMGLLFNFWNYENIDFLSVIVATAISHSFGMRQYKIEIDKMFKELFIAFNEKFDT